MQSLKLCFNYTFAVHSHHPGLSQMCVDVQPFGHIIQKGSMITHKKLVFCFQVIRNNAPWISIYERKIKDRREGRRKRGGRQSNLKMGKLI